MTELEVYVILPQPALDVRPLPTSVLPPTRSASVSHALTTDDAKARRMSLGAFATPTPTHRTRSSKRPTTSGGRPGRQAPGWEGDEVVRLLKAAGLAGESGPTF